MRLVLGDCLDRLRDLPEKSVDLILADMPYGTTRCRWDSVINLEALWPLIWRVSRGPVLLFAQLPFDKVLGASQLSRLRYEWVWEKTHATGHLNAKKMPLKSHENVLVFYESLPRYFPIMTHGHVRKASVKRGDRTEVYGRQGFEAIVYDSTSRYPRSVQVFSSDKQKSKLHPTQKPVGLCDYLIRTYTEPGDTVLDFCMGSGSTGVAALQAGRSFIGIEKDEHIFNVASSRLAATSPRTAGAV